MLAMRICIKLVHISLKERSKPKISGVWYSPPSPDPEPLSEKETEGEGKKKKKTNENIAPGAAVCSGTCHCKTLHRCHIS